MKKAYVTVVVNELYAGCGVVQRDRTHVIPRSLYRKWCSR